MKKIYLPFFMLALLLAGCRTPEYYQDQAVQKAREYLLKKSPQLSFEDSSYIRFNKPSIVHTNILGGTDSLEASRITSDVNQIQIVWNIPGNDNFFAVWGVCSSTMRDFTPERIFVRKFNPQDTMRLNAVKRARAYIIGNLFSQLSVEDYNYLRFRDPEIFYSKFELEKDIMPSKGDVQTAMVWTLKSKPEAQLVVIGNCRKNLANFKPVSGSELAAADVKANLLEPYKRLTAKEIRDAKAAAAAKAAADKKSAEPAKKAELQAPAKTAEEPVHPAEVKKAAPAENTKILSPDEARIRDIENSLKKEAKNKAPAAEVKDEKIVDELPEAPVLDTENDLKEPDK